MAIVTVTMLEGRPQEVKDRVMQGITDVLVREIDPDPRHIRILIDEIKAENYAVAGKHIGKPKG